MKKTFILFLLAIISLGLPAQDIITKRNGEEIQAKVLNINDTEINYIKWSNLNGPTYTIAKSDVFMIKYENGEKDVFGQISSTAAANTQQQASATLGKQLKKNNLDFIKQEDLFKKGKRLKRGGTAWAVIFGVGFLGGCIGSQAYELGTGAVIGLVTGGVFLTITPCALMHTKGNKLIAEAEAMSVTAIGLPEISIGGTRLAPCLNLFTDRQTNENTLGLGARWTF